MIFRVSVFVLLSFFCRAQTPGKTAIFKVRAPASKCTITTKNPYFLLEMNNPVVIKLTGRNKNIEVLVSDGKVMSTEDDTYYIRFTRPGIGVISVYQNTPNGRRLIGTKMLSIKNPQIYFCGIKMDSTSRGIKLIGTNFYAYSDYYKQQMPITSFEMYYVDDTTVKKIEPVILKSDTCMISKEMRKKLLNFQPHHNYIYFNNIICKVPDGSKRILDPIELNIIPDTINKKSFTLMYSVRKKKF